MPGAAHIVLVHGSLDRSAGMTKLSRRLEDGFRVTRYDRRGYGRSMPHAGPFGIDAQVDDLVHVIASAPDAPAPCVVFGHSYGGNVALATAERHPELVAGVVVYETPLSWLPWWPGTTAGGDARAWEHDPAGAAERFMRRLIGDARWERLPEATREARRAEGVALVGELGDLGREAPWSRERITAPVLAMRGELGPAASRAGDERASPTGSTRASSRSPAPITSVPTRIPTRSPRSLPSSPLAWSLVREPSEQHEHQRQ